MDASYTLSCRKYPTREPCTARMVIVGSMPSMHISEELILSIIAKTAHQVYRSVVMACEKDDQGVPVGFPTWDELGPNFQAGAVQEVARLIAQGCDAAAAHASWMAEAQADGWMYNRFHSVELKMHPRLVPFRELSEQDRLRCGIFAAVAAALTTPVMPSVPPGAERLRVDEELPPAA